MRTRFGVKLFLIILTLYAVLIPGLLNVYGSVFPQIVGAPNTVMIGETVTITCVFPNSSDYQLPNITWFEEDNLVEIEQEDSPDESRSIYSFQATKEHHFVKFSCFVFREHLTEPLNTSWTCIMFLEPLLPIINGPTVMRSGTVYVWTCSSTGGYPKPKVSIVVDNVPADDVTFEESSDNSTHLYNVDRMISFEPSIGTNGSKIWCEVDHPETMVDPQIVHITISVEDTFGMKPFNKPSFIYDWYEATAGNSTRSLLTIEHNLNEYPAKVDVQVKVHDDFTDEDYIFTGVGSAHRDDDHNHKYGGIIYKYNDKKILLSTPFSSNGFTTGGVAYTGYPDLYTGPNVTGFYTTGMVRVRAWVDSDMPELLYKSSVYMEGSEWFNFKELNHNVGFFPDIVTVQTMLKDGYMSDGQGVASNLKVSSFWNGLGGVIFGYDAKKIRLWVPSSTVSWKSKYREPTGVFVGSDGWKLGDSFYGTVRISMWKTNCFEQIYHKHIHVDGEDYMTHDDTFLFPCSFDLSNIYVSVQIKANNDDGDNAGMMFYGTGTTMATGQHGYGGIVYAYTENKLMIWKPADEVIDGSIINIGGRWGSGRFSQQSYTADVIIRVFSYTSSETCQCSVPSNVTNATLFFSEFMIGGQVTYSCDTGYNHTNGDLTRYCLRNLTWSGKDPMCTFYEDEILCPEPNNAPNATIIMYEMIIGGQLIYRCDSGFLHISGDLDRYCLSNQTWNGTDPVCVKPTDVLKCSEPHNITNATIAWFDKRVGGKTKYICNTGFQHVAGNLIRFCLVDLTWSGTEPICASSIEFFVAEVRTERKNTNSYKRTLISVWDERTSSLCIGVAGVAIIVIPLLVCVLPDLCLMWRHATYYAVIYQGTKRNMATDNLNEMQKETSNGDDHSDDHNE